MVDKSWWVKYGKKCREIELRAYLRGAQAPDPMPKDGRLSTMEGEHDGKAIGEGQLTP